MLDTEYFSLVPFLVVSVFARVFLLFAICISCCNFEMKWQYQRSQFKYVHCSDGSSKFKSF